MSNILKQTVFLKLVFNTFSVALWLSMRMPASAAASVGPDPPQPGVDFKATCFEDI
jgi:hypothetical protein